MGLVGVQQSAPSTSLENGSSYHLWTCLNF